jgi:hypothetical protein
MNSRTHHSSTEDEAISAWNTRTDMAASQFISVLPEAQFAAFAAAVDADANGESPADISQARIAQLEAALKPFADYMQTEHGSMDQDNKGEPLRDDLGVGWIYLTHGNFRKARDSMKENDNA